MSGTTIRPTNSYGQPSIVSRLIQMAFGFFVTTIELPIMPPKMSHNSSIGFDCDFTTSCRWSSVGIDPNADRWKLARGEPDTFLWLAATGTMDKPVEPFALLEVHGSQQPDVLASSTIACQQGSSLLSFTYWTIGAIDLEICLLDLYGKQFNCTGHLKSNIQPGKVALKIPPLKQPFRIAIIPSTEQGIICVDDIHYDARYCGEILPPPPTVVPPPNASLSTGSPLRIVTDWSAVELPPLPTTPLSQRKTTKDSEPFIPLIPPPPPLVVNPFVVSPILPTFPPISKSIFTLPPLLGNTSPPHHSKKTKSHVTKLTPLTPITRPTTTEESEVEEESAAEENGEMESKSESGSEEAITTTERSTTTETRRTTTKKVTKKKTKTATTVATTSPTRAKTTTFTTTEAYPKTTTTDAKKEEEEETKTTASSRTTTTTHKTTTPTPITTTTTTDSMPILTGVPNVRVTKPPPAPSTTHHYQFFELLVIGNKTRPLFDRRRGKIIHNNKDLLCDFANNFPCFWGPETGKWAIIDRGAIPSLDVESDHVEMPTYPAALVLQGSAVLASDPIRCQMGDGKLLFRYWTNDRVSLKVCAMGSHSESSRVQCVEKIGHNNALDPTTLAVFEFPNPIRESFTLNIMPNWDRETRNGYLVIDEIAYIGECNVRAQNEVSGGILDGSKSHEGSEEENSPTSMTTPTTTATIARLTTTLLPTTILPSVTRLVYTTRRPNIPIRKNKPIPEISVPPSGPIIRSHKRPLLIRPIDPVQSSIETATGNLPINPIIRPENRNRLSNSVKSSMNLITAITMKPGTRYPYYPSTFGPKQPNTVAPIDGGEGEESMTIYPGIEPLKKKSTTKHSFTIPYTTTQKYGSTTEEPILNYCRLLNCDFNENACHYLNHGLTKAPWTLRNKGYGFPLSRSTDIRTTNTNGQFVSTVLGPGDFAILESPRFNLTEGINVLLLQYYRPTHSATIRLCLGTRYSKPLRTANAFLQCPPILRSITSKNTYKWNSVHIQLPPGTTHFYLVAHNLDRSSDKTAIAIDNIRVAICDPRAPLDTGSDEFMHHISGRGSRR